MELVGRKFQPLLFALRESSEPRVYNHRSTILATALGHETLFDTNGNNQFDNEDGGAVVNSGVSSGFGRTEYLASGFIEMSEAWRDDNENGIYNQGETFIDFDNNNVFADADGLFNGPQCSGDLCATQASINVRKSLVLIMASGASYWAFYETQEVTPGNFTEVLVASNRDSVNDFRTPINRDSSQTYSLFFGDTAL